MKLRRWLVGLYLMLAPLLFGEADLMKLAEEYGAVCRWDYWRDIGTIEKGDVRFSFRPGDPWLFEGFQKKLPLDYIRRDGNNRLIAGVEAEQLLRTLLKAQDSGERQVISAIILDPGHGGRDSGAVSPFAIGGKRLLEKDVVLDIALKVYAYLKRAYPEKNVLLTRGDDRYLALEERTDRANSVKIGRNEAVVFVSIHANASLRRTASGFEVWYLPPEMKRNMVTDSMREKIPETEVLHILDRLLDEETTVESIKLAGSILNGMSERINGRSENRGLKEEAWYVVRNAKMPSVLVEVGFVTNKAEAEMLASDYYRNDLASGIFNGISRFVEQFEVSNGFTEQRGEHEEF